MVVACQVPPQKKAMSTLLHVWSAKLSCGSTQTGRQAVVQKACKWLTSKVCSVSVFCAELHCMRWPLWHWVSCHLICVTCLTWATFQVFDSEKIPCQSCELFHAGCSKPREQSPHPSAGTASSPHQKLTHHTIGGKLCSCYGENRDTFEWKIPALAISCMLPNRQYLHYH